MIKLFSELELKRKTVKQLQRILKDHQLPSRGNQAEFVRRVLASLIQNGEMRCLLRRGVRRCRPALSRRCRAQGQFGGTRRLRPRRIPCDRPL